MKLPLEFGIKLFFRLLLPGFFLTLGLLPILFALLDTAGLAERREVAFVVAVIIAGWGVLAADDPIYRFIEGRRGWPEWLQEKLLKRETERLRKLSGIIDQYFATSSPSAEQRRRYLEASVDRRAYPIGKDGERYAEHPTRLGNVIAGFETYPDTRYGLSAIFYWPRIWVHLDKDIREDLDNQQAVADSAVYCTFALGTVGALLLVYCVLRVAEWLISPLVTGSGLIDAPLPAGVFRYVPSVPGCLVLALTAFLCARLIYFTAISTNEQFGTSFMAVVDAHATRITEYLDIEGISRKMEILTGSYVADEEKFEVTRRYLQYFQVKLPGQKRAISVARAEQELDGEGSPP